MQIVCYKQYIQTVSLLNDFVCVLQDYNYCDNICHILCTCIYLYEYSYEILDHYKMENIPRTEYMNTNFLQCDSFCEHPSVVSL